MERQMHMASFPIKDDVIIPTLYIMLFPILYSLIT